jgi:membrane-associated phospholipid phosphatase
VNTAARIISIIFHPLLTATYLFLLLSFFLPSALSPLPAEFQGKFIMLIFIMTFVLPSLFFGIFKKYGYINSLAMKTRSERVIPFIFVTVLYLSVTWMFHQQSHLDMEDNLFRMMILGDSIILLAAIITLFYKASIHSMGIWGIIGIIFFLNNISENDIFFLPMVLLILLAGFIMASRLQLQAHTPREVLVGTLVGFAAGYIGMIVLF